MRELINFKNKGIQKIGVYISIIIIGLVFYNILKQDKAGIDWISLGLLVLAVIGIVPNFRKVFKTSKIIILPKNLILQVKSIGNYVRLEFGVQADYESITLKNAKVNVKNNETGASVDFEWEVLYPYQMQWVGDSKVDNYSYVSVAYKIQENNIISFNAGFRNENQDATFSNLRTSNESMYENIKIEFSKEQDTTYGNLENITKANNAYNLYFNDLKNNILWKKGSYEGKIILEFIDKIEEVKFNFEVTNEEYLKLEQNIHKIIMIPLANTYTNVSTGKSFVESIQLEQLQKRLDR